MSALGFTNQRERLRLTVAKALEGGATYASSREEDGGRSLLIEIERGSRHANLRFRGVEKSDATAVPAVGSQLRLKGVSSDAGALSLLGMVVPFFVLFRGGSKGTARVTIDAGGVRLDIVCQDAEWWEELP